MEHTILVAFTVEAEDRTTAELHLMQRLPKPEGELDSWWVAEDVRHDGSDNDSAVFVHPGKAREASLLLVRNGLSSPVNIVSRVRPTVRAQVS